MAGRFVGSALLTRVDAARLLTVAAVIAALLCLTVTQGSGAAAGIAGSRSLLHSIMFPVIFVSTRALERSGGIDVGPFVHGHRRRRRLAAAGRKYADAAGCKTLLSTDVRLCHRGCDTPSMEAALDPPGGDGTLRCCVAGFYTPPLTFHGMPELNTEVFGRRCTRASDRQQGCRKWRCCMEHSPVA